MKQRACSGFYSTGDGHQLYWARYGKIGGHPIFFLHGGPGGSSNIDYLDFFNLDSCDVILFDQRGCGRSQPKGALQHNNTSLLVDDIEALRCFLGFAKINLLGISWGSWLALLYQHRFPENTLHIILASLFIPFKNNVMIYERALMRCLHQLPWPASTPLTAEDIFHLLHADDPQLRRETAKQWANAMAMLNGEKISTSQIDAFIDENAVRAIRLELHYHLHDYFFSSSDAVIKLSDHLLVLQGKLDSAGMRSLYWLRQQGFLNDQLFDVGHNAFNPILQQAIWQATSDFGR